jgi:hypothetical protein
MIKLLLTYSNPKRRLLNQMPLLDQIVFPSKEMMVSSILNQVPLFKEEVYSSKVIRQRASSRRERRSGLRKW